MARAADAQATMQRRTSNLLARMQLLEAEQRAALLLQERQEMDRVTWESGWARRRGDMSIWEGRCRTALLGIYWERVEELGRWAGATVQCRLGKVLHLRYQLTWDQSLVRLRSQEEGAKLWDREGVQIRGIVSWHVRVLERAARRELQDQAQQGWASIVTMEGPERLSSRAMGHLLGAERAGREQIRERSMFLLHMEAAATRKEQGKGGLNPNTQTDALQDGFTGQVAG